MPAGRELDALVAERVMELHKVYENPHQPASWFWSDGDDPRKHRRSESVNFAPSREIDDAWKVAEKMGLSVLKVSTGWQARLYVNMRDDCSSNADTAPLAICRAALTRVTLWGLRSPFAKRPPSDSPSPK